MNSIKLKDYQTLKYLGKLKTKKSTEIAESPMGVGFECLDRDMWDINQALPVINDLGIKWARVQTGWAKTEKEKGIYNFKWLDDIVDQILEQGVQPWLSISYGNPLYTKKINSSPANKEEKYIECEEFGVGFPPINSKEERNAWQNYVRELVKHFKNRITHYEVWNEPDLLGFWKGQPKAAEYVDLVRLTSEVIREEQDNAIVIGGAIAWGMTVWSLKFLEDCMKEKLYEFIDIVTYHGYKSVPERHSNQEIKAFTHIINKYKPSLLYWQGEAGMQSYVPEEARGRGALSTMKCSESIQARMLLRRSLIELHNGCSMTSYFHMADFAHYAQLKATFHYGLVRLKDGSKKPAYYALQSLCSLLAGAKAANGCSAAHMSLLDDTSDPRATKAFTWHANFVNGETPIHAYWIPESLEDDPIIQKAEITYWLDSSLKLKKPVLIEPVSQEVYEISYEMDKKTCAETCMDEDPTAEGIHHFKLLPVSTDPLIITDLSLINIIQE